MPADLRFTACHFSLVTTPPANLTYLQRIPHVDSLFPNQLAFIHYLFRANLGGTAFYRHRATGFESVDQDRKPEYWRHVEAEQNGPDTPPAEYIRRGHAALRTDWRLRKGSSTACCSTAAIRCTRGAMAKNFIPDPNPRTGRLSINGFLA